MFNETTVIYYWYYGGMEAGDREKVEKALRARDFDTFIEMQKKYPEQLPEHATIFLGYDPIGELNITFSRVFEAIDEDDSEWG